MDRFKSLRRVNVQSQETLDASNGEDSSQTLEKGREQEEQGGRGEGSGRSGDIQTFMGMKVRRRASIFRECTDESSAPASSPRPAKTSLSTSSRSSRTAKSSAVSKRPGFYRKLRALGSPYPQLRSLGSSLKWRSWGCSVSLRAQLHSLPLCWRRCRCLCLLLRSPPLSLFPMIRRPSSLLWLWLRRRWGLRMLGCSLGRLCLRGCRRRIEKGMH